MDHEDYFHVNKLINMKQLFDARVHLGHHEGTWDPLTRPYIYGMRSTQHIIDLEKTVECLQVRIFSCDFLFWLWHQFDFQLLESEKCDVLEIY